MHEGVDRWREASRVNVKYEKGCKGCDFFCFMEMIAKVLTKRVPQERSNEDCLLCASACIYSADSAEREICDIRNHRFWSSKPKRRDVSGRKAAKYLGNHFYLWIKQTDMNMPSSSSPDIRPLVTCKISARSILGLYKLSFEYVSYPLQKDASFYVCLYWSYTRFICHLMQDICNVSVRWLHQTR